MNLKEIKRIGGRQGLICAALGLSIAQLIMTTLFSLDRNISEALFWFTTIDYKLNIVIGAIAMFVCGYFYGQLAAKCILLSKSNFLVVGCLTGLMVLLTTAFIFGWTGFIQEGIDNIGTMDDPFFDYILKPFYWITIVGAIPALLVGLWFGVQVKRAANRS